MPGVLEAASSGRAKCRGCGVAIAKGELRLGEKLPNAFGEGEMTHWFHPLCAAYKRPEVTLEVLGQPGITLDGREKVEQAARHAIAHPKTQRVDGAERAPGSQARCRQCKELIEKGGWRIRLVFYNEGVFEPGGFLHLACRAAYFETDDLLGPLLHFSGPQAGSEVLYNLQPP